jgi:hypothetical protein
MSQFLTKYKEYWSNYGFEILSVLSLVFIFILFIYNWYTNKRGTYTDSSLIRNFIKQDSLTFGSPPRDSYYNYREHTPRDSKLELTTKYHLEQLFRKPFYKIRPEFLKNKQTGRNLEIDLFNKELNLAVEVQGIQHYKYSPRFHLTPKHFEDQLQRDQDKALKCRKMGIRLIEIPYHIKENEVQAFLLKRLRYEGFNF